MLVLTRRRGEGVTIGPDIRVVVLGMKGGQVRLGIEAPLTVEVHRDEVYARIQDENRLAARTQIVPIEAFQQRWGSQRRQGT
ncbi:Carbon storage regulator-like protein [Nitrospira sp. KM1]|uniref:carbon storage regulator CsrA n=1 Tax=Nitrospira sp. KM1 TaxID=1936990 RepID=UPI0013A71C9A|nr:carbon storage regulator CsrA [Nitrospira sp. KM1]BCA54786.1 Carbon storage regulator-like protein [Nitrospira sp. KM1]